MEREMRCLPFLLGIGEKLLGIEKKIKEKGRWKINLLEWVF